MYFKKLEIFGFKSFADKTAMNFEPGITAIVGPNGCGKSNVFDAIRWVLGEQSVKELRGSSMEDVIFNGTDKKSALGFAEVSLTFSNESKILPVDYNEVTVTRRLFRSGESEYMMNKTQVRLKDIVELFMGTGIGAEAYSLVQQGRVDLVVSGKPEDRRAILDEASGITKYKSKRREALNKLRDTEANLLRLNDIVLEVKRQISSLDRQANKARRYKDEFEKLKSMEVQFAQHELKNFKVQQGEIHQRSEELKNKEIQLNEELDEIHRRVSQESLVLEQLEDKINEIQSQDIKFEGQIDINNRQIGFNDERLANIDDQQKRIIQQKDQLFDRCRSIKENIEEIKELMVSLDGNVKKSQEKLIEKRKGLESIADAIKESNELIHSEEEKILDITSRQVQVKNRLTEVMKEVQGCLARQRRSEMEKNKVADEKQIIEKRFQDINQKMSDSRIKVQDLQEASKERYKELDQHNLQLSSVEQAIAELEKKKLFRISQKEFIETLSIQYQDMPDPVVAGRLFIDVPPLEHHSGIIGKVKEVMPVGPLKSAAIKKGFPGNPKQLYEICCETKFIELDPHQIEKQIEDLQTEIGKIVIEKDNLNFKIEEQKSILSQSASDLQEQEKILSIYEAQKNDLSQELKKLEDEMRVVDAELGETVGSLSDSRNNENSLSLQLDEQNQCINFCHARIKEHQTAIAGRTQEREELIVSVAQLETEVASVDEKKRDHDKNLKLFYGNLDSHSVEIEQIDKDFSDYELKKEGIREEIEVLKKKIEELKSEKHALRDVIAEYQVQREDLDQKIQSLRAHVDSYHVDLDKLKENMHRQELLCQEISFKEKEIKDRLLQAYKIDIEHYQPPVPALEQKTDKAEQEESSEVEVGLNSEFVHSSEVKAESFEAYSDQTDQDEIPDVEQLLTDIQRLRKRCDSFGSVNLVAIEEFEELKERYEFLTKQQSDLLEAKADLHQTIVKINRQTRQMFMDTFTKVSEEFRIYFRMLFGGGEAQLVLLDPENVLESGIEIIARPPGKKLQNINLLSGGEKSLTAIALIFGVFKVNPSPFCVLDEIDAALDESNVGRFSYLLKDFAKIAQFIIITHNKKTIAAADVMYGVTMQETGVSKIVSVKFGDDEVKVDAERAAVPAGV